MSQKFPYQACGMLFASKSKTQTKNNNQSDSLFVSVNEFEK